jgi:hypothetical protein
MMSMQVIFEAIAGDSTFRVAGMGIAASITLGFHPFLAVPVEHASVIDQRGRHRNDKLTHRRNLCLGTVVAYYMVHYNWSGQDCKVICAEKRARPPVLISTAFCGDASSYVAASPVECRHKHDEEDCCA